MNSCRGGRQLVCAAVALLTVSWPSIASAQQCQGAEPRGGMWAASGELYIDRAQKNPNPQDKRGLYQQAIDILEEGFQEQPNNPRNFLLAGQAYVGKGEYQQADSVWTVAEDLWSCYEGKIDTLRFNAWARTFNRGVQYSQAGELERAAEEYRRAYTIYSVQPQAPLQLGTYYANRAQVAGDPDEQAELQEQAVEYFREALDAIDRSHRLKQEDRREFSRAATFNLAQLLALQERYREAAQAYRDFLDSEPDNVTAKSNLAVVLTLAADVLDEEAEALEDTVQKGELLAEVEGLRAEAEQEYRDLLTREDLDADQYHNIGAGLSRAGDNEAAIAAFRKALDLEPYRASSLEQLAHALFSEARYDTLITVAQTLADRYPNNLNNLALLANAHRELDEREKALEVLELRESLQIELLNLSLETVDGVSTISGHLQNKRLEPGTPVEVQFELYDNSGEVVASATLSMDAPEQDIPTPFNVGAETAAAISGFTYHVVQPASESPVGS